MINTKINFYSQDIVFTLRNKNALKKWVKYALVNESREAGEISFIFCSDNYLLNLNKEYLSHDTFTDIITFDYTENKIIKGDVFISIDRVNENAVKFGTALQMELKRVIIHGVLHLCGYKDKNKSDRLVMREKEDFYLEQYDFCKSNL